MPEYIFTNLPQYVKLNSRSEFSSSVVSSGAVLLFTEDGLTLTGKLPDGTFITIGGKSGTDPVGNATDGDLLAGKSATVSGGSVISGTIPTVSASLAGSQVVVPAGYIAVSQTFNVSGSGIDVGSTTAEAADVLAGKIFYTSGGVQTSGTIPTVSATLAANVATVPSGYIASAQTLTVPLASSATVAGGIVTIPAGYVSSAYTVSAGGAASAMNYYRCASVTSGGSTWTGYLAVLSGGSYSFASSVTSGLTYGSAFIPEIGNVYSEDATIMVAKLYTGWEAPAGYVFYAPLDNDTDTAAETGQSFTVTGSPVSTVYLGVPCMQFSGSDVIEAANTGIPYSESPFSISLWVNIASNPSVDTGILAIGHDEAGALISIVYNSTGISLAGHGPDHGWDGTASVTFDGSWKHMVVIFGQGEYNSRTASLYIDGTLVRSGSFTYSASAFETYTPQFFLGSYWGNAEYIPNLTGSLAAVRIYSRALTSSEITTLAGEFTPSAA